MSQEILKKDIGIEDNKINEQKKEISEDFRKQIINQIQKDPDSMESGFIVNRILEDLEDLEVYSDRDLFTMAYDVLIDIADKYPVQAGKMLGIICQNGHMIPKDHFIDGLATIFSRPSSSNDFLSNKMISSLNYLNTYFDGYEDELVKKIDFENNSNYAKTSGLLLLVAKLSDLSSGWEFSEGTTENLKQIIKNAAEQNKGSYLLNSYAKFLSNTLERKNTERIPESYVGPALIAPHRYGYVFESGLYISSKEDETLVVKEKERLLKKRPSFVFTDEDKLRFKEIDDELIRLNNELEQNPKTKEDYSRLFDDNGGWHKGESGKKQEVFINKINKLNEEKNLIFITRNPNATKIMREYNRDQDNANKNITGLIKKNKITEKDFVLSSSTDNESFKQDYYAYLSILKNPHVRMTIEKDFSMKFEDFSLQEQFQFVNFIKSVPVGEAKRVGEEVAVYGSPFIKSFLSLEQGGKEMGEKIVTLGEKLPKENAALLFKKYGEIVGQVENITEYISESLSEKASPELVQSVRDHLLINGKNMLSRYAKEANKCTDAECENLGKEIEDQLSSIKTSVVLLSSVVKTLVEKNEFNFDDFKNIEISYDRSKLSSKNISDIYMMVEENTKQYPEKLRDYWRSTAIKGLQNPEPNEMLIYVKNKEDVLSFMRVTPQPDGSFYGGSFNVNPLLQGSRIGTEFMKKVIDQFTETGDFNADVWSDNPMLKNYIEKFNFEKNGEIENYHDTGATIKKIIRRKKAN